MLEVTNLQIVKQKAKLLLYIDLHIVDEMLVQHPYFSTIYGNVLDNGTWKLVNLTDDKNLCKAREHLARRIDEVRDYREFMLLIRAPYLPAFFKLTKDCLSIEDYSEFLGEMWTYVEYPNTDVNLTPYQFISVFKKADKTKLMDEEEYKEWLSMTDRIVVYRGIFGNGKVNALSWTLSKNKAKWFANRFGAKGNIYQALINKKDILAYFSRRGEEEVVLDYRKLCDVRKIT